MFLFHAPITQQVQTQFQTLKTDPSESPIRTQTLALIGVQYSGSLVIILGGGGAELLHRILTTSLEGLSCVSFKRQLNHSTHARTHTHIATHVTALAVATSTNDTLPERNALLPSLLTPRPPCTRHRLSLTNTKTPGCLESSNDTSDTKGDWQHSLPSPSTKRSHVVTFPALDRSSVSASHTPRL